MRNGEEMGILLAMNRLFHILLIASFLSFLTGCNGPVEQVNGGAWYRGTTQIDPPDATVFGPPGDVAIQWEQLPSRGVWIWKEFRPGWNQQTVWTAGAKGTFMADVSTGAWSGPITLEDWQELGMYTPGGWKYGLALTNGNGVITGTGDAEDDSPEPGPPDSVYIKLTWLKNDGTVGARMTQTLRACNEEEFNALVQRLGGNPQGGR